MSLCVHGVDGSTADSWTSTPWTNSDLCRDAPERAAEQKPYRHVQMGTEWEREREKHVNNPASLGRRTIQINDHPLPVRFARPPLPLVVSAAGPVREHPLSVARTVRPLPVILPPIRVLVHPMPVDDVVGPLTVVPGRTKRIRVRPLPSITYRTRAALVLSNCTEQLSDSAAADTLHSLRNDLYNTPCKHCMHVSDVFLGYN